MSDTQRLVQLPNWSWVRPDTVTSIKALPTETSPLGTTHRARVIVKHGDDREEILANNEADALQIARDIALIVNGANVQPGGDS